MFWKTQNQLSHGIFKITSLSPSFYYRTIVTDNDMDRVVDRSGDFLNAFTANVGKNSRKYKDFDGIITGVLFETGETYYLQIKASELDKKTAVHVATEDGEFHRVGFTDRMKTPMEPSPMTAKGPRTIGGGTSKGNLTGKTFEKDGIHFEVTEVVQQGSYVEVKMQIISEANLDLSIDGRYSKAFIADGGKEFTPTSLKLADKYSTWGTTKTLMAGIPAEAVITFTPNQEVELITKLKMYSKSSLTGNFNMEIENLKVQH